MLRGEYHNLYASLFESYEIHEAIVKALSTTWTGLTRDQLIAKSRLNSGGGVTKAIEELALSGFIAETVALDKKSKGSVWRISDEFPFSIGTGCTRKLRRIPGLGSPREDATSPGADMHSNQYASNTPTPSVQPWYRGRANATGFLALCGQAWLDEEGAQIDLLIDRADRCMNSL